MAPSVTLIMTPSSRYGQSEQLEGEKERGGEGKRELEGVRIGVEEKLGTQCNS